MRIFLAKWQKIDWLLFFAVLILLVLGISILYSLSLNTDTANFAVFKKQILFALSGFVLFFFLASINYNVWLTYAKLIFILFVLVLLFVLFFGVEIKGTTGWLSVGPFVLQPVEFAKIALVIALARYFAHYANEFFMFKHIFISGLLTLAFVGLVTLQPDLGSALVLLGTWIIMLLFTGIKRQHFWWLLAVFLVVVVISWFFLLQSYQQSRILTFFNPGLDPQGEGYNVIQSIIAVGSGQTFGRGLALGSQSSLRFLPEPGTDFIFAVIAEDLGLVGTGLLLALFAFIFYRLFLIMRKSQDDFGAYLILGIAAMLLVQTFINIGMNMGISPVTGIPLPLVSAGGSSVWAVMIALGIAQSVHLRNG
ncbi:rod shape-determining protein RodA [Patescibacteria group bacterium]|nr:rod shape-determining protein RodA [Patescibacteria group bacterium]